MNTHDQSTITVDDLVVDTLGSATVDSPIAALMQTMASSVHYVHDSDRVLLDDTLAMANGRGVPVAELPAFEPGGPRLKLVFDPTTTRVGIVTCGGLCPGLNNVIRGLVLELTEHYGVPDIVGFVGGYRGLTDGGDVIRLTTEAVHEIQNRGGTILGTTRGGQDVGEMVDTLAGRRVDILFVIGGDGTLRGAQKIADEAARRSLRLSVIGIPKTIDNDIPYIDHSFGFQTAFARAAESIRAAHTEAQSTPNAVVVVAEGAGQDLLETESGGSDASGNAKLADIGRLLQTRIAEHFAKEGSELTLRYVDPGYAIRSVPANAYDGVYSVRLAQAAVHAAMSGRTAMVVGRWHGRFVHVPIKIATRGRNEVDPNGDLWMSVLETTGQPPSLR